MAQTVLPTATTDAVLVASVPMPDGTPVVSGMCFDRGSTVSLEALLGSYENTGFQGTSVGQAIRRVDEMLRWRLSDEPEAEGDDVTGAARAHVRCKLFLGYTSNLISSGLRDIFRFLVQHKLVDVVVTTAGGIEEDIIKCLAPTFLGDFALPGRELRLKGINRIGNLLVPNDNYCKFEDFLSPVLDAMLDEQESQGVKWTPSKMIHRLGKEINNEDSVYYWAYKNDIPVYCPAITDGSIGDMIYFHSFKQERQLVLDIVQDIKAINNQAVFAKRTGMIILGGGVVKHHICNANLMRNGADYSVFINTGQEFDGSDSGARPDEAISWGKIKLTAQPVKVYADATIVFPLVVAGAFYPYWREQQQQEQQRE